MLAKLLGLAVLIWFYKTAKQVGENAIQWAVFGVIGFFLSATIAHYVISEALLAVVSDDTGWALFIRQLPIFLGLGVVYLLRKKCLLKDSGRPADQETNI